VLEDHMRGCVVDAVQQDNADPAITEMMTVRGEAMGR
jgi:DNA-binding FrmR family transcriptional regulator